MWTSGEKRGTEISIFVKISTLPPMKQYILLRDNQETGPYTADQLHALAVQPNDLIWVDGESTHWQKASTVNDFHFSTARAEETTLRSSAAVQTATAAAVTAPFDFDTWAQPKATVRTAEPQVAMPAQTSRKKSFVWIGLGAAILIALFVAAKSSSVFEKSSGNNSAPSSIATKGVSIPLPPVPKTVSDATAKSWGRKAGLGLERLRKPGELRKGISVGMNDYDTDFFGGINGLQLTLINTSVYMAERVKIRVDYLRPGGEVIETKVITVRNVPAQGEKVTPVEDSKRGVRVSATILSMQ